MITKEKEIVYPKLGRIPFGKRILKNTLDKKQLDMLLKDRVVVEEKMDGKHIRFETQDYVIFAEDMKRQHTIFYVLPGRYAVFDIYDKKREVFVSSEEKIKLSFDLRKGKIMVENIDPILFFPIPTIEKGKFRPEELFQMIGLSAYARDNNKERTYMEGIVVKPDMEMTLQVFLGGKIVRQEFEEGIKIHYLRLPARYNIINPSLEVVVFLKNMPPNYPSLLESVGQ
ncbi:MAG: RNA ligase family protein [Candidatus Anstonellales archaeon]